MFALIQSFCLAIVVCRRALTVELRQLLLELLQEAYLFAFQCLNFFLNLLKFLATLIIFVSADGTALHAQSRHLPTARQINLRQGHGCIGRVGAARVDQDHF